MKYKVGDKVRIRKDLVMGGNYGDSVAVDDMVDMGGNVVTIERAGNLGYYIEEDPDGYCWTDEMFEPVEEMSAIEALYILAEICMKQYTCSKCPIQCIDRQKTCVSIRKENPTDVVKVLEQWKADHEKKEIEVEFAYVVRVIEDTGKVKRCVYEEDVTEVKEEAMKRVLKEYCKEHEGKLFTVYEEICRVKE
ncbi:hypothetical protein [Coprococcus comes]|uniref:Uncharacterized protein n=1 Tax=Coprococcus comes TaxID=410072 RepID=A0A414QMI1_9FIRM|nr:hypothetical protein [Coprococcus comes]RHF81995.1 hypothetical protein DW656_11965 [Coprococcus comes]